MRRSIAAVGGVRDVDRQRSIAAVVGVREVDLGRTRRLRPIDRNAPAVLLNRAAHPHAGISEQVIERRLAKRQVRRRLGWLVGRRGGVAHHFGNSAVAVIAATGSARAATADRADGCDPRPSALVGDIALAFVRKVSRSVGGTDRA